MRFQGGLEGPARDLGGASVHEIVKELLKSGMFHSELIQGGRVIYEEVHIIPIAGTTWSGLRFVYVTWNFFK